MGHKERLSKMKVRDLKREISKQNIKGYSKMRKGEVIDLIIKNKKRFPNLFKVQKSRVRQKSFSKTSAVDKVPKPYQPIMLS